MESLVVALQKQLKGEVTTDLSERQHLSHDGSIYELMPEVVIVPTAETDIEAAVSLVLKHKATLPKLSITPRTNGTDVSGGAIGSSIVLDMTHVTTVGSDIAGGGYPTTQTVRELRVVLGDGKSYTVTPLTKRQLAKKTAEPTFEGHLYEQVFELVEKHYDLIKNARPRTAKNSMGYNVWDIWDRDTEIFNLAPLFIGSQGTLGIITDAKLTTPMQPSFSRTLLAYLPSSRNLHSVIETIEKHEPAVFEGFDDLSFSKGIHHAKTLHHQLGLKDYTKQQSQLLMSGIGKITHPPMFFILRFNGESPQAVIDKISSFYDDMKRHHLRLDIEDNCNEAPTWHTRRASFKVLRNHINNGRTAPFLDDMAVPPQEIATFLPELRKVLSKHRLPITIHGNFRDGTFQIVPFGTFTHYDDVITLEKIMREIIPLITKHSGTLAAEHNDGMIRGPWLPAIFGQDIYNIFRQIKEIFDPLYIFNPYKKTDASWEYSMSHLRASRHNNLPKQR